MTPVRLRLSRAKSFNLQEHSLATNGLPAVVVRRPTKWGNPFTWHDALGRISAARCFESRMKTEEHGALFRENFDWIKANIEALRGKNLACTCALGQHCHADVLIEIANKPICEEVK